MNVQGFCDAQFQAVRGEFEQNFQERGEVGASVCVVLRGQIVVNLWAGWRAAIRVRLGRRKP